MRIFIIDTCYPAFLNSFYSVNPRLKKAKYRKQWTAMMNELFGTSDFYSYYLNEGGNPSKEFLANNEFMQDEWAKENDKGNLNQIEKIADLIVKKIPFIGVRVGSTKELKVLKDQIDDFKPDVVYNQNLGYINPFFIRSIKSKSRLIVGQIASPTPPEMFLHQYDLIISSMPHFVKRFKKMGIKSEYMQLGFDPRILKKIPRQKRDYEVTFIGGISRAHKKGFKILNGLADKTKIDVWGYGKDELDKDSNLYKYHHGESWGKDMYKRMLKSKITINRHIDVAKNNANNARLYEATGCGAMLLTDEKQNLNSIFETGKEVVAYKNLDDLIDKIDYYSTHSQERVKIAKAGQKKTLKEHCYKKRMSELSNILQKYI